MNYIVRSLKIIISQHISEKSSFMLEKNNIFIFKVLKNANKLEIKYALEKIFDIKVKSVYTLILKGKKKRHGKYIGKRNGYKKAYVTLKKGQKLDFININK
ncbi:50S ribosomal protein L23 [Candidatus Purcelliella pentastirinorum]|uniref:Large ribosomal subunit protein uL23 n=1 Tax=Candidatus Purcelliella pentastirinorum TaxID=472834 RepID=A0A346DZM8_9ENTR|nr:50S ribosomal protein L23 [Candidatus Purcelliella pentastirinorum]AXN02183.1 LSU ribosomal protein L23p (L23Ae) [Candidatus Purcelliella pentastirinorum]WDI79133.1 50S ribosomal protein L23 [Candidatus Purcelliella pentastirinorum]WDR80272.1 50S ribosomal protein L23 [Candidatus Purcelliella pentastirinorum]